MLEYSTHMPKKTRKCHYCNRNFSYLYYYKGGLICYWCYTGAQH